MSNERDSSAGFTLLELVLALSLAVGLLTGFFVTLRTFFMSLNMVSSSIRGSNEATELLDRMAYDLEHATGFYASSSVAIDFQTPAGRIAYQLVQRNGDPKDAVVLRYQGGLPGTPTPIGPTRLIANFNPFAASLLKEDNTPTTGAVDLFSNYNATPPSIQIQLVLQPTAETPAQYVRAAATPRVYR